MDTNVSVSVRVRPLNSRERESEALSSLRCENKNIMMLDENSRPVASAIFAFGTLLTLLDDPDVKMRDILDNVFDEKATNGKIFNSVAKGIVHSALEGVNGEFHHQCRA